MQVISVVFIQEAREKTVGDRTASVTRVFRPRQAAGLPLPVRLFGMPAVRLPRSRWARALGAVVLLGLALTIAPYTWVQAAGDDYTTDDVPSAPVAIVLGAGINPDGTPKPYLRVRLEAAKELYDADKVDAILVSGDHGSLEHDEVEAMTVWLTDHGVARGKVVGDPGLRAGPGGVPVRARRDHDVRPRRAGHRPQGPRLPDPRGAGRAQGIVRRHRRQRSEVPRSLRAVFG